MSQITAMATLVRGKTYFLGTKRFDHGVPVGVTEEQRTQLETFAIDYITAEGDGDTIERPKFRFEDAEEVGAEASGGAAPTTATRARGRK